jgi:hypothetical protein
VPRPTPPVLFIERDEFTVRGRPGGTARLGEDHERQQSGHLAIVRHQHTDQSSEPECFGGEFVSLGLGAGAGGQTTLVEDKK